MFSQQSHSIDVDDLMEDANSGNSIPNSEIEQHLHHHNLLQMQPNQTHKCLKKSRMNKLIMDYLEHEGFKEAAERFRDEAGIKPKMATESMDKRVEIRQQIEKGNILQARSLINDQYPELFEYNHNLNFRLHQQHLIELIRRQSIDEVLAYVHDQLSVGDSKDLAEMEKTLVLLAYETPNKCPYSNLLELSHRLELASEVNDTLSQITWGQIEPARPRLVTLLKLLCWTQKELDKKKIHYSKMNDLFEAGGVTG